MKHRSSRHSAFTLVELLIVLAIIGLLAAILFPAFKTAQERGFQANCATNMQQIYQAVQLYRQDEKYYPASLAVLLPADYDLADVAGATTFTNTNGTGYFKGGRDTLLCKDDDTDSTIPRSSYGDISKDINASPASPGTNSDMSRYLWNYWGYYKTNAGSCASGVAKGCAGTAVLDPTTEIPTAFTTCTTTAACPESVTPTAPYHLKSNPIKYSLSNRFAPVSTVITHCVFHRLPTASGKIASPTDIYDPALATSGAGARDIVLRLDGSAKLVDVSQFVASGNWQKQTF